MVGEVSTSWLGHSYGGNLIQENSSSQQLIRPDEKAAIGFFFERVTEVKNDGPYKTEIFATELKNFSSTSAGETHKIFEISEKPFPSTVRVGNGYLAEGPRPLQLKLHGKKIFLVGFSSGDFPTDQYHLNFLIIQQPQ